MKKWLNYNLLKIIALIMLLGAALSSFGTLPILPFTYYQLMNWAVVGASLIIIWQAYQKKLTCLIWIFSVIAVIFNPITPIYLGALTWQISDIIVSILFIVSFFLMKDEEIKN